MTWDSMAQKKRIWARLRRGKEARALFASSHISKAIGFQIRSMRERRRLSQSDLAALTGMAQNAISRLESAEYGRPSITTLKRLAEAFDVALVVRFAPFSELTEWVSTMGSLDVLSFEEEAAMAESTSESKSSERPTPTQIVFINGRVAGTDHATAGRISAAVQEPLLSVTPKKIAARATTVGGYLVSGESNVNAR